MKVKFAMLVFLFFVMVACPSKEDDQYLVINDLSVNATSIDSTFDLQDGDTISRSDFGLSIQFNSSLFEDTPVFALNIGAAYASYEPFYLLKNKVKKVNVWSRNKDGLKNMNVLFSPYVENSLWLSNENLEEGCRSISILQFQEPTNAWLVISDELEDTVTASFYLSIELDDGSVLKDSTCNFTIIEN